MLFNFVSGLLSAPFPDPYYFIPLVVTSMLIFVLSAVILNFFFGAISQFLFKS